MYVYVLLFLLPAVCSGIALRDHGRRSFSRAHAKPNLKQNNFVQNDPDGKVLPSAVNCTWKYVEQPLSHFSRGISDSYMERLCIYDKYWKSAEASGTDTPGPVFFYTGNESPVEEYVNNTGLIWDLAVEFNALIVFAEHRYFGESIPNIEGMPNCLAYLSSQEALADYASIINLMRRGVSAMPPSKTDWTELSTMNLSQSAFITFGGSYGGMLSAWMRIVYPNQIDGAIAASAPIWGFPLDECETDGSAKTVTFAASPGGGSAHLCADNLKSAYVLIDNLGKTQEGRDLLSSTMGLCSPLSSERDVSTLLTYLQSPLFNLAEGSYPFETDYITFALTYSTIPLPAWPMRVMCEDLKYDYGVEIFGTPEDVKFTVSSTTPKVEFYADWEITSNSYRSDENLIDAFANVPIDHNNSMGLLHDVAAAIQIWYNLTGVETCVNWDDGAAPSSNSQSSFVSLEISTNMVDSNVCTMNAAEFDAGLGWNTLTCNEGLNLINWWVQGVGNDLYYPPNQKKDYEYADLVSHSLDYCAAFKSQGLYGIPDKGHYDTWSLWDDTTYGGLRLSQSSNIVFTNGNLDPWIAAGVTLNTSSIKSLVIDQGAHHLDLFFPTEQDPESVKKVRAQEAQAIKQWVQDVKDQHAEFAV